MFLVYSVIAKLELVDVVTFAVLLYTIIDYVEFGLAIVPEDKNFH